MLRPGRGETVPESGDGRARHEHVARGIALRIISALFFSGQTALLKVASAHGGVVAPEMLFYRALFGLPVVLVWVGFTDGFAALLPRRVSAHVGRSVLGICSILCTFQSIILLPLADATTIGFTAPIFATILSWLILSEHVGKHRWIAVVIGFIGVVVVTRPGAATHALPVAGVLIGLIAALGTASVTITLRKLGNTEHVAAIVFWFFTGSVAVGACLLPFFGRLHDWQTMLFLAGGGVAGGLAQITMTASLQAASVSVVSPFDYVQIVGAMILGWLLLDTAPAATTLAGAAIIAGSGLYTAWREHRRRRVRPIPATQAIG